VSLRRWEGRREHDPDRIYEEGEGINSVRKRERERERILST
jgi:hypothetical protein